MKIDQRKAPGFGDFLLRQMERLYREYQGRPAGSIVSLPDSSAQRESPPGSAPGRLAHNSGFQQLAQQAE